MSCADVSEAVDMEQDEFRCFLLGRLSLVSCWGRRAVVLTARPAAAIAALIVATSSPGLASS